MTGHHFGIFSASIKSKTDSHFSQIPRVAGPENKEPDLVRGTHAEDNGVNGGIKPRGVFRR
jgi:hypothetical protein